MVAATLKKRTNMKKRAYIAPVIEVHTISVQQMICESIAGTNGDAGITQGEGDPEPQNGGDSRRHDVWGFEDEEE